MPPALRTLVLALPPLAAAHAGLLFDFVSDLQQALWSAYEPELLDTAMLRHELAHRRACRPPPPLTGQEAFRLAHALERARSAVCLAHGEAIAHYLASVDPDATLASADLDDATIRATPDLAF